MSCVQYISTLPRPWGWLRLMLYIDSPNICATYSCEFVYSVMLVFSATHQHVVFFFVCGIFGAWRGETTEKVGVHRARMKAALLRPKYLAVDKAGSAHGSCSSAMNARSSRLGFAIGNTNRKLLFHTATRISATHAGALVNN